LNPTGIDSPELAMDLTLGGARADRAPRDCVGDVLGRDRVQELAAHRHAEAQHVQQQLARHVEAGVDVPRPVEVRVVDHALPARRRARLLEVDAHRDAQVVLQFRGPRAQALGIVERGIEVVHAARADDHEQAVVRAVEDAGDLRSPSQHEVRLFVAQGQVIQDAGGRHQLHDSVDAAVVDLVQVAEWAHLHGFRPSVGGFITVVI
jgi:hypothetical protein